MKYAKVRFTLNQQLKTVPIDTILNYKPSNTDDFKKSSVYYVNSSTGLLRATIIAVGRTEQEIEDAIKTNKRLRMVSRKLCHTASSGEDKRPKKSKVQKRTNSAGQKSQKTNLPKRKLFADVNFNQGENEISAKQKKSDETNTVDETVDATTTDEIAAKQKKSDESKTVDEMVDTETATRAEELYTVTPVLSTSEKDQNGSTTIQSESNGKTDVNDTEPKSGPSQVLTDMLGTDDSVPKKLDDRQSFRSPFETCSVRSISRSKSRSRRSRSRQDIAQDTVAQKSHSSRKSSHSSSRSRSDSRSRSRSTRPRSRHSRHSRSQRRSRSRSRKRSCSRSRRRSRSKSRRTNCSSSRRRSRSTSQQSGFSGSSRNSRSSTSQRRRRLTSEQCSDSSGSQSSRSSTSQRRSRLTSEQSGFSGSSCNSRFSTSQRRRRLTSEQSSDSSSSQNSRSSTFRSRSRSRHRSRHTSQSRQISVAPLQPQNNRVRNPPENRPQNLNAPPQNLFPERRNNRGRISPADPPEDLQLNGNPQPGDLAQANDEADQGNEGIELLGVRDGKVYLGEGRWIRQQVWNLTTGQKPSKLARVIAKALHGDRILINRSFVQTRCQFQARGMPPRRQFTKAELDGMTTIFFEMLSKRRGCDVAAHMGQFSTYIVKYIGDLQKKYKNNPDYFYTERTREHEVHEFITGRVPIPRV